MSVFEGQGALGLNSMVWLTLDTTPGMLPDGDEALNDWPVTVIGLMMLLNPAVTA